MSNQIIKTSKEHNLEGRITNIQNIILRTIVSAQKYKIYDILGANELNICISTLDTIFEESNNILNKIRAKDINDSISNRINNCESELIIVIKNFGTDSFIDLINIILGCNYIKDKCIDVSLIDKFNIISRYVHPINFKIMVWKTDIEESNKKSLQKNRIIEDHMITEYADNLDCFDLARTSRSFQTKVYGIKINLHDYKQKKTYIVACIVDDIILSCLNYSFVINRLISLNKDKPTEPDYNIEHWEYYVSSLTLKELLVYNNSDIYLKFQTTINQLILIKQKTISQVVKEFLSSELYSQRTILIQLLIKSNENEYQYLAYLLYDLLSNESNGTVDTLEQTLLYDSLPWNIKKYFRNAMKQTIQYTNNLYNFDNNKIPLEQQICLLKANDNVKEKAILKLKEIKAKSEDSGTKARQYLDGLLKIPFAIIKEEPILTLVNEIKSQFNNIYSKIVNSIIYDYNTFPLTIKNKERYTNVELMEYIKEIKEIYISKIISDSTLGLIKNLKNLKKDNIIDIVHTINQIIKSNNLNHAKLNYSGKKILDIKNNICDFITIESNNYKIINGIYINHSNILGQSNHIEHIYELENEMNVVQQNIRQVTDYMIGVNATLNNAIFGHEKAKRQIERIIGQWINGEKSGYCFGFEGPPGVGKTSLAKRGIAYCLKDNDGQVRPFSFIAVGGSANGSTLEGHNYTYVGSTWGRIVDILIETKCMNPIIFIDELDKISRTEHGKEIIGILTHLIDPTQNDAFQDKYFSGIDLDLSKALFIFSYNDVEVIDRILLDRIHRIKFKHLSLDEKLVITHQFILPEIYKKMGLVNIIELNSKVIEYIIHIYTNEPGVRKLKEILFEIIGEINLSILTFQDTTVEYPIVITIEDLRYKYLKDRHEHRIKKINNKNNIGVINGLWANSVGQGGLLPIEARFLPSTTFLDLKLTGMQGDVMKESMNVSRTLAWELLEDNIKKDLLESFEKTKCQGIHIHVPEGSTPKDGPSGGAAITTVVYSLLSKKLINKDFAMTGEICLQGRITAIGGLDLKILGGIESGVTNFIYPKDNDKDYTEFIENLKNKSILDNITFHPVENIEEVLSLILID
jgi:ATP-dependent Lon protease